MRSEHELEELQQRAYRAAGWIGPGEGRRPVEDDDPEDPEAEQKRRDFAEGVEAGILFALGRISDPLPKTPTVYQVDVKVRRFVVAMSSDEAIETMRTALHGHGFTTREDAYQAEETGKDPRTIESSAQNCYVAVRSRRT